MYHGLIITQRLAASPTPAALIDSRRNFRSRQVLAALDYLHEVLRVYGQLPWPPKPEEIPHAHHD